MKLFLVLALAVYGTSAAISSKLVSEKWDSFKATYKRNYVNVKEEAMRKQIFQKNIERFEEHNEKFKQGLVTYTLGVNHFADMTEEEMRPYIHGLKMPAELPKPTVEIKSRADLGIKEKAQVPQSFDWRDRGVITPVKDQGRCGSCWAFSATGAIEAQERIQYGSGYQISASEQQLVDCVQKASGCDGGWMQDAFTYVAQSGGIDSEDSYPYESKQQSCRYNYNTVVATLQGYGRLSSPDENLLVDMVFNKGPVSVAFDDTGDFGYYSGGVYYNPECSPNHFTHAVLVVGYGSENGQDYWLVKNSWGTSWGDNGYFKIARNRENHCGIASKASYPLL